MGKIDTREFLAETNESQRRMYCRNMQIFISRNIFKVLCEFSKHYEGRRISYGWIRVFPRAIRLRDRPR
jgi:hypothetical protein